MKKGKVVSIYKTLLSAICAVSNAEPCAPKNSAIALKGLEEIKKSLEEEIIGFLPIHGKERSNKYDLFMWVGSSEQEGISLLEFMYFLRDYPQFVKDYKDQCLKLFDIYLGLVSETNCLEDEIDILILQLKKGIEANLKPEKLWSKETK